jgi:hypothetical protein
VWNAAMNLRQPVLMNLQFVILNGVKNPHSRPPLTRGFFAALLMNVVRAGCLG